MSRVPVYPDSAYVRGSKPGYTHHGLGNSALTETKTNGMTITTSVHNRMTVVVQPDDTVIVHTPLSCPGKHVARRVATRKDGITYIHMMTSDGQHETDVVCRALTYSDAQRSFAPDAHGPVPPRGKVKMELIRAIRKWMFRLREIPPCEPAFSEHICCMAGVQEHETFKSAEDPRLLSLVWLLHWLRSQCNMTSYYSDPVHFEFSRRWYAVLMLTVNGLKAEMDEDGAPVTSTAATATATESGYSDDFLDDIDSLLQAIG